MNKSMANPLFEQLLEELNDIEGIDPIGWWPLGIGWWALIITALGMAALFAYYLYRRRAYQRSWKNDALRQLTLLEEQLSEESALETAAALSEYLRRIALVRFSRQECAGLAGSRWLKWLAERDPQNFDWESKGKRLIDAPYAPSGCVLDLREVREILKATKRWVR